MSPEPQKPTLPPPKTWREKLINAKKHGASDSVAANFAGLTEEELEDRLEKDPSLDRELREARAGALLDHLESISKASQWQAHEYLRPAERSQDAKNLIEFSWRFGAIP